MNKITTLAAISMFAVIMGLGAFAPAAVASPNSDHNPKESVCHFDRDTNDDGDLTIDDRDWEVKPVNKHSRVAHLGHGDYEVGAVTDLPNNIVSEADCTLAFLGDPDA